MTTDDACSRSGCDKPVKARGLCATDYAYAWKHGTLPPKTVRTCQIADAECAGGYMGQGLCVRHYSRYYLRGTPKLTAPQRKLPPEERFRFYVSQEPCACGECDGCLRWEGGKNGAGYGMFYLNGSKVLAHRYAWELESGEPIPAEYQVDHVRKRGCRHRDCVKYAHLEPVPLAENLRRAQVGDRAQNGEKIRAFWAKYGAERFWAKTDQSSGPEAHWLWLGFIDKWGHAKTWWQGGTRMAKDIAWVLANGDIPDGEVPVQKCGRTDCVNPAHLKLISRAEAAARKAALARAGKARKQAAAREHPVSTSD